MSVALMAVNIKTGLKNMVTGILFLWFRATCFMNSNNPTRFNY